MSQISLQDALKRSLANDLMTDRQRHKRERTARALAVAFHGDEGEWRGFLSKAEAFLAALSRQDRGGK